MPVNFVCSSFVATFGGPLTLPRQSRAATSALRLFGVLLVIFGLAGCAARPGPPLNLPAPVQSTTVGPGDVFSVVVVGEKELPTEFRVQPDGTIDFPYVDRVTVSNLEPQDIVVLLKKKLVEAKVLQDPQVMVIVKQYNSKKVTVIGSVTKPGNVAWTEGMGIVDAISQAGWFTPIGDSNHVILTRRVSASKTVTAVISVEAISNGQQADVPLQTGDTIKIDQRTF
jgi:protein involved in polysaccharide export with SLBB domain